MWEAATVAVQSESVQQAVWEWLLTVSLGIGAVSGAAVIIWKVAVKPHFTEFIRKATEVHTSVTVNGGRNSPPTLLDKVHEQGKQLTHLAQVVKSSSDRTEDLGDKVDLLGDLVQDARDDVKKAREELEAHESQGKQYLGQVEVVLRGKGIELPPIDNRGL